MTYVARRQGGELQRAMLIKIAEELRQGGEDKSCDKKERREREP